MKTGLKKMADYSLEPLHSLRQTFVCSFLVMVAQPTESDKFLDVALDSHWEGVALGKAFPFRIF
jgi:hypothetical protein